ncbi:hypothetical protein B0H14DRAFT_2566489 [Mycena olivaceomarginata]|nr:hypothetical protein B0H14DRAFT_2566489 [Mycena olivaceomarginata]
MNNVSSRNGPNTVRNQISLRDGTKIPRDTVRRIMAEIDPDGAETRFPGRKPLRMGPVGIDIYGSRCHSSSQMVKFMAVPNPRCSSTVGHYYLDLVEKHGVFVQATVDGGSETGELYTCHVVMRQQCMPELSLQEAPAFVALKSTDNIPIESSSHLFTNYVGLDLKEIILLGKSQSYFNPAFPLHILDDFVDYWNDHKIRTQRNKALPSGVSPKFICGFPERFGLTHFGTPAPQDLVDTLHQNIPKSREECYRWVSDEFEVRVSEIYDHIGAPKLAPTEGWTIFCQMLPHFE